MKSLFFVIFIFNSLFGFVYHRPFIVVTPQKTGTHLLTKALTQLLHQEVINEWQGDITKEQFVAFLERAKKSGTYPHMHALPRPHLIEALKERRYRVLFLMRDPRDQLISLYFYIQQGWKYGPLRMDYAYGSLSLAEKFDELITGSRYHVSGTLAIMGRRIPWMYEDPDFVLTLRFENLVGEEGGSSREAQILELEKAMAFIEADISRKKIRSRSTDLFGKPGEKTFRKGQIGEWRDFFTPELKETFKRVFGDQLIYLGYEADLNW
jgi:hypothetical protein